MHITGEGRRSGGTRKTPQWSFPRKVVGATFAGYITFAAAHAAAQVAVHVSFFDARNRHGFEVSLAAEAARSGEGSMARWKALGSSTIGHKFVACWDGATLSQLASGISRLL